MWKKIKSFLQQLQHHSPESPPPKPFEKWKDKKNLPPTTGNSLSSLPDIETTTPLPSSKPRLFPQKIRVPFLKQAKKWLAGLLLLLNGFMGFICFSSGNAQAFGWFFLLNSFIFLDYIWKLSHYKIIKEEASP